MSKTVGTNTYSDDYLLKRLHTHIVKGMKSKYTLFKPTWQAYLKRMDLDADFASKVNDCLCEGDNEWEELGIAATKGEAEVNAGMYKTMVTNKRFALSHEVLELEERIKTLEESQDGQV